MNVTLHSIYDPLYLLIASLVFGVALFLIRALLNCVTTVKAAILCKRFLPFNAFAEYVNSKEASAGAMIFSDIMTCILFAVLNLCLCFIFNSGIFRLLSLVLMYLGFVLSRRIFKKLTERTILAILFLVKWAIDIVTFPFFAAAFKVGRIVKNIFLKTISRRRNMIMKQYTAKCFEMLSKESQYGFIDDYYKELLK